MKIEKKLGIVVNRPLSSDLVEYAGLPLIILNDLPRPTQIEINDFFASKGFKDVAKDVINKNTFKDESESAIEYYLCLATYFIPLLKKQDYIGIANALINEIKTDKVIKKYGPTFITHMLMLIKSYCREGLEYDENDDSFENDFIYVFDEFLKAFTNDIATSIKSKNYLFHKEREKIELFITTQYFPHVIKDIREIYFNIEIFSALRLNYPNYPPLKFLNILYEFIEMIKFLCFEPVKILDAIKVKGPEFEKGNETIESNFLLYWILFAINYKIGFSNWIKEHESHKAALDVVYKILNGEAKILGCSPEIEHVDAKFLIPEETLGLPLAPQNKLEQSFNLTETFTKADLTRLFNAIWECRLVENNEGQLPDKKIFMEAVYNFFGTGETDYAKTLESALGKSLEENLKIFDLLKAKIQTIHFKKLEGKKSKSK